VLREPGGDEEPVEHRCGDEERHQEGEQGEDRGRGPTREPLQPEPPEEDSGGNAEDGERAQGEEFELSSGDVDPRRER